MTVSSGNIFFGKVVTIDEMELPDDEESVPLNDGRPGFGEIIRLHRDGDDVTHVSSIELSLLSYSDMSLMSGILLHPIGSSRAFQKFA